MYKLRNIELANLYEEIKKQKRAEIQKKNTEEALIELEATNPSLFDRENGITG